MVMSLPTIIILLIVIVGTFIYTLSYGKYVWNQKNKLGAFAVILLALIEFLLPMLTIFLRG